MGGRCCCCCCCCTCCPCRRCRQDREEDDESRQKRLLSHIPLYSVDINHPEKCRLAACRLSDFRYKERIGYGRYGQVFRVVERRTARSLAMKEVPKKSEIYALEPRLEMEHVIMSKLKSPWLVEMFQCYETHSKRLMLLQYLPGPSLLQLVKTKALSELTIKVYAAQMLMAVQAVHSHGYMHRDIKMANFLLDHHGHVKLCDFGSCIRFLPLAVARRVFPPHEALNEVPPDAVVEARYTLIQELQHKPCVPHGTSYYCAPEVICQATWMPTRDSYTYLCDYWSLGVCLYYLMYRRLPFYSDHKVQVPSLILHWDRTLTFPRAKAVPDSAVELLRGLLQSDATRLGKVGVQEISRHHYFRGIQWAVLGEADGQPLEDEAKSDMMAHLSAFKTLSSSKIWRSSVDHSPTPSLLSLIQSVSAAGGGGSAPGKEAEMVAEEASLSMHVCDHVAHTPSSICQGPSLSVQQALAILRDYKRTTARNTPMAQSTDRIRGLSQVTLGSLPSVSVSRASSATAM